VTRRARLTALAALMVGSSALVACSGWFFGCTGSSTPRGSHGVATPLGAASGSAAAGRAAAPALPETLSLEQFAPLLAQPMLARARQAHEAGNARAAAAAVRAAMAQTPPASSDVGRWQMLLARLLEESGDPLAAAASYDLAAREPWVLAPYARLGAGRTLLRSGRGEAAFERLRSVPLDLPAADETRLLLAEAAFRGGKHELAIDTWRKHLEAPSPSDSINVSLRLIEALLARAEARKSDEQLADGEVVEALRLARKVAAQAASKRELAHRAGALEKRALELLPRASRAVYASPSPDDELERLRVLVDLPQPEQAEKLADGLLARLGARERWGAIGCEASFLRAKALAALRKHGRAADALGDMIQKCKHDLDLRARSLYLGGHYAAIDGRHTQAVQRFEQLEREAPAHRLADDARLKAALSYFALGVEARFTELLSSMPDVYPEGDMVLDGVFRLALRRIEKGDWQGAAAVLDRAFVVVGGRDSARGTELSGRERYFRARAWMQTGEKERGIDELEAIVQSLPLSYYMLHAYSRLREIDPARAQRARDTAVEQAKSQPFAIAHQPQFETPGFRRAMELLALGDFERGKREIEALGFAKRGAAPELLWGVALLWARAGGEREAHEIARGLLTDWLSRWPAGDWARAWELAYPRPYRALVERETKKNGVPPALVYGVMREESAFDPQAVSRAQAYGLMQLIVPTAKLYGGQLGLPHDPASLKRPAVNIALGTRMLSKLEQSFAANPPLIIPAYNAGPGRPRRWLRERPHIDFDVWVELIPFTETRRYTKRVLSSRAVYGFLYAPETAEAMLTLPAKLSP
jgi:soluble lytic murein transglycosylase